jgi:CubicO group peptidase (beta-lactamase class C family)
MFDGAVAEGWGGVAEAFGGVLENGDVGAQLCICRHGEVVVDLVGGYRSAGSPEPVQPDDLYVLASVSKGVTAIALGVALQRGQLDPGTQVATLWPDFGAQGKDGLTIEQVLSHQAGLFTIEPPASIEQLTDWEWAVAALAAMEPCWPLDGRHGYHPLTWGWLAGEILRRATGREIPEIIATELAAPLGIDLWIGAPAEVERRLNPMTEPMAPPPDEVDRVIELFTPGSISARAFTVSGAMVDPHLDGHFLFNSPRFHATPQPAGNGISNARSLAKLYAACLQRVDGVRVLDDDTLVECMRPRVHGRDEVTGVDSTVGLGMLLSCDLHPMMGPGSFGHHGSAGSLAFAHQPSGTAFAYVSGTWQTLVPGPEPRQLQLIDAVRAALT